MVVVMSLAIDTTGTRTVPWGDTFSYIWAIFGDKFSLHQFVVLNARLMHVNQGPPIIQKWIKRIMKKEISYIYIHTFKPKLVMIWMMNSSSRRVVVHNYVLNSVQFFVSLLTIATQKMNVWEWTAHPNLYVITPRLSGNCRLFFCTHIYIVYTIYGYHLLCW